MDSHRTEADAVQRVSENAKAFSQVTATSCQTVGMKTLLNVIWLVLCGFWMAVGYVVAGIVCCILIITIPFGLASFRIANYALWPFGRTIEQRREAGAMSAIGNVIWIVFAGWWLAIGHIVTGVLLCLTIIGIPLGIANLKMIPISLIPLGSRIVPTA
jgi:uncharacterized membrane protein YccF (DUF307 family)